MATKAIPAPCRFPPMLRLKVTQIRVTVTATCWCSTTQIAGCTSCTARIRTPTADGAQVRRPCGICWAAKSVHTPGLPRMRRDCLSFLGWSAMTRLRPGRSIMPCALRCSKAKRPLFRRPRIGRRTQAILWRRRWACALRLKASYDISGFSAANQVILTALQRYGMIMADNGSSMYLSGAPDDRWDNDDLHLLGAVQASISKSC